MLQRCDDFPLRTLLTHTVLYIHQEYTDAKFGRLFIRFVENNIFPGQEVDFGSSLNDGSTRPQFLAVPLIPFKPESLVLLLLWL